MDSNTRSTHRSQVKRKLRERMPDDARLLREHDPELYELLWDAVCREQLEERVERLENEVEELRDGD